MVRVTISETYDLSTKTNKMSIIGIKTPSFKIVKKSYPGLLMNHKFIRFVKADVRLACASVLPADPQQIGVEAGDIAPQDMFNPILYKAMSNQAMNTFEQRLHGVEYDEFEQDVFMGESLVKTDNVTNIDDDFANYYMLLSNRKGWKVAHPQRGLVMASLRPLVYERLYADADDASFRSPNMNEQGLALDENSASPGTYSLQKTFRLSRSFRGRPHVLPPIPTNVLTDAVSEDSTVAYNYGTGTGDADKVQTQSKPGQTTRDISCYVACILTPPAKLNKFYYRLVVRWTIDFIGCRPVTDILGFWTQHINADTFYGSDYFPISLSKSEMKELVDVRDADIEKVMEGI